MNPLPLNPRPMNPLHGRALGFPKALRPLKALRPFKALSLFKGVRPFAIGLLAVCTVYGSGCQSAPIDWAYWQIPAVPEDAPDRLSQRMVALEDSVFAEHVSDEGLLQYRIPVPAREGSGTYLELADQACWTGYLLASVVLRSHVERSELKSDETNQLEQRIESVLSGMLLLEKVTGVDGLIARCAMPTPIARQVHNRPADWRIAQHCRSFAYRADVSKDQYSGYVFGLACCMRFAPRQDQRQRAAAALSRIARHFHEHSLRLRGHSGAVTRFGDVRGRIAGVPIGVNAAISLAVFQSAAAATPDSAFEAEIARVWSPALADALRPLHVEFFGVRNYSNALMASVGIATVALVSDSEYVLGRAKDSYRAFLPAFQGEGNAFFYSVGRLLGIEDSAMKERCYRNLYFAPTDTVIRPLDSTAFEPLARRWIPSRKGKPRLVRPLPLAHRPPTSFRWRSDPFILDLKSQAVGETKVSGADLLVAYWLGRLSGWIPGPAFAPPSFEAPTRDAGQ